MRTVLLLIACAALAGCGGKPGKRDKANDSHCWDEKPQAYQFDDPDKAYEAGCDDVRIHRGKTDPKTGETVSYEDLVFCCPK